MKKVTASFCETDFCCGAVEIGNFDLFEEDPEWPLTTELLENLFSDYYVRGCVFKIATFTNTPECKAAYKVMCDKLKLVSQSPVKRNPKSGNRLFVAVFTNKEK